VTRSVVLGRPGGGADLVVADPGLSRRHARLWPEGDAVWFEDLGSVNGSWVAGVRLEEPRRLLPGLEVRLGHTTLTLVESPELPIQLESSTGLTGALASASYIAALYGMVESLLGGMGTIPDVLARLRSELPAAERLALVSWPPPEEGSWRELTGGPSDFVSRSLARYAVERGRALLFSDRTPPSDLEVPASALFKGIRSAAYVPLQAREEILAVLCVDCPQVPLTPGQFHFVCAVGGLLLSALAAERLREEARLRHQVEARREGLAAFLKIASHDLKGPLHAITNGAQLLRSAPPDRQSVLLDIIARASARAEDLIKSYLDVAQVEHGRELTVEWSVFDPRSMINEEFELFPGRQGLVNAVGCGPIRADERKLRQVFANLLSNAAKFSPSDSPIVVRSESTAAGVRFSVHDQGVGISLEDQEHLFQAFQRVGEPGQAPGSGLGLWLSAALVAAQGGRLGVTSTPGEGSTFWFELPQQEPITAAE